MRTELCSYLILICIVFSFKSAHGSKETTSSEQPNHSPSVKNSQHNSGECKIITGEQVGINVRTTERRPTAV